MNILWIILIIIGILTILYLFAVKPRNQAIHDWKPHQEALYAHRGLHDKKKGTTFATLKIEYHFTF